MLFNSHLTIPERPGSNRSVSSPALKRSVPPSDASDVSSINDLQQGEEHVAHKQMSNSAAPRTMPDNSRVPGTSITTLMAGPSLKTFYVHTDLLQSEAPYFAGPTVSESSISPNIPLSYPELDEFAMSLFIRWLYGAALQCPTDYYSMTHCVAVYVLASKFQVEKLCNESLDMIRHYYRNANMTAPAYRLEYVYAHTSGPNGLRRFMTGTAAYRALCEGAVSQSIRIALGTVPGLAGDFATALIDCHKSGLMDCRRGADCAWHVHDKSEVCKTRLAEPWERT